MILVLRGWPMALERWPSGFTLAEAEKFLQLVLPTLQQRIAALEDEVRRLKEVKADRRGPKPKPIAQGDARQETTL